MVRLLLALVFAGCALDEGETGKSAGDDTARDSAVDSAPETGDDSALDSGADSGEDSADSGEDSADCPLHADADGDGYGDPALLSCDGVTDATDCDDAHADAHPGAPELCDARDNDCDGAPEAAAACIFALDDVARTRVYGTEAGKMAGSPTSAGDLDGDGIPDAVVRSYGPAFVLTGADVLAADTLDLPEAGVQLTSDLDPGWYAWFAVGAIPDLDGDGRDELALGDPASSTSLGDVWILRGMPTAGALDDVAAAHLYTSSAGYPQVGYSVATLDDALGEGTTGLAIGAPYDDDGFGTVWLVDAGVTGEVDLSREAAATIHNRVEWAAAGASTANAGDVDGDGLDDLLVGGVQAKVDLVPEGAAWLLLGPLTGSLDLADADALLHGGSSYAMYGWGLAGLGDTDGDGHDDFAVGATDNAQAGWIDVWPGTVRGQHSTAEAPGKVQDPGRDGFGANVAGPGDINQDGLGDLALAGTGYDSDGATFVWWRAPVGTVGPEDADLILLTETRYGGSEVSGAGDVDGDGRPDLWIGAERDGTRVRDGGSSSLVLGGVWEALGG